MTQFICGNDDLLIDSNVFLGVMLDSRPNSAESISQEQLTTIILAVVLHGYGTLSLCRKNKRKGDEIKR
jgi:hypothetical protein